MKIQQAIKQLKAHRGWCAGYGNNKKVADAIDVVLAEIEEEKEVNKELARQTKIAYNKQMRYYRLYHEQLNKTQPCSGHDKETELEEKQRFRNYKKRGK